MSAVTVLTVSYDGAAFSGFQSQPGLPTVQGRLETALRTILRREVAIECAGRTDTGVHALGQVVSFASAEGDPDGPSLIRSVNALAGHDVVATSVRTAGPGFSARHSATSREYRYRLTTGPVPPLFTRKYAWWARGEIDLAPMQRAASCVLGEHDFASFCVSETAARVETRRSVDLVEIFTDEEMGEELVVIRIAGRSFLHSMVRILVGSLVEVGRGRKQGSWMAEALSECKRAAAGPTAPAHGLTLWRVEYPSESFR